MVPEKMAEPEVLVSSVPLDPAEVVRAARQVDPTTPPARVTPTPREDVPTTLNLRLRLSSVEAISAKAEQRGITLKLLVTTALRDAGVKLAPEDLVDRSTRRRGRAN